jgi:hypothetical protein
MKLKILIVLILGAIMVLSLVMFFSPYQSYEGFPNKLIKHTIEIQAPVEEVYAYLGNSANASNWSVFVHHITVLNADSFPDGSVGSRRRCFVNAEEKGTQWDELISEVSVNKKRQLELYNLRGFSMTANHLATEQLYEAIDDRSCRLTFSLFYKAAIPTLPEKIKTHIASYKIHGIFKKNMENIKYIIENKQQEESS